MIVFNTAKRWSRDLTEDVVHELCERGTEKDPRAAKFLEGFTERYESAKAPAPRDYLSPGVLHEFSGRIVPPVRSIRSRLRTGRFRDATPKRNGTAELFKIRADNS